MVAAQKVDALRQGRLQSRQDIESAQIVGPAVDIVADHHEVLLEAGQRGLLAPRPEALEHHLEVAAMAVHSPMATRLRPSGPARGADSHSD